LQSRGGVGVDQFDKSGNAREAGRGYDEIIRRPERRQPERDRGQRQLRQIGRELGLQLIPQIGEQRAEAGGVADRQLRDQRVDDELADVLDAALPLAGEPCRICDSP
jgi:hypothetical protein